VGHLEPSIIWLPFAHAADAQRVELRMLGRQASRAAFRVAAAAWQAEHGPAAWAEAALANDEHGAPHIAGHVGVPLVSITHTRGLAGCSIAIPGAPAPGIDAEPLDSSGVPALRALAEETGEARHPWKDDAWPLRMWCAKESVVKAERFGADALGRTLRIEHVGALEADGTQRVVVRSHRGRIHAVVTAVVGEHVRAWTG
jgi:4'-phosphopantetheinyl transferase EntD